VSLADALCGAALQVRTLDGRTLDVPVTSVITPGSIKIVRCATPGPAMGSRVPWDGCGGRAGEHRRVAQLQGRPLPTARLQPTPRSSTHHSRHPTPKPQPPRGEGMPISKTGGKGDLRIKFEIAFPRQLSPDQKQQLRGLLAGAV
jgi:hypothetical protein